jgi:hypothetical protein
MKCGISYFDCMPGSENDFDIVAKIDGLTLKFIQLF